MNIGIMKQGKSILFDKTKWGPIGGDNEASAFIYLLAKTYPQHMFWIIGRSDYSRIFKNPLLPNIKDLWAPEYWDNGINPMEFVNKKNIDNEESHFKFYNYIIDTTKKLDVNIDFCFVLGGMHFSCTRMFYSKRNNDPNKWTKALENAYKYQGYQNQFLDEYKPLYTVINTDPRHATGPHPKDLVHMPFVYLSQINKNLRFSVQTKCYPRGKNFIGWSNVHKNVYAGVETLHMLHKQPLNDMNTDSRYGFTLILNQGIPKEGKYYPPRYIELKRYILDDTDFDCSIYGKWDEDIIKSDSRFKGPISPLSIQETLSTVKYTLCIPIQSGWTTAKFTEMASLGVIPFVTYDYASEAGVDYIHPFLKVKNSEELKRKIEQVDSDNEIYLGIRLWLERKLSDMYSGKYLLDSMFPILEEKIDFGQKTFVDCPLSLSYNKNYIEATQEKKIKTQDDLFD